MDAIRAYKLKSGNVLKIYADENAESPRDWDNLNTMVCFHNRYNLGDKPEKHGYRKGDYGSWEELAQAIIKQENPVVILPLYLYDHSGLRMKVGSFSGLLPAFHAEFDSGQVGFIFASRKAVLDNWSIKRVSPKRKEQVEKMLREQVEEYDQYLRGDVYGFRVVKPVKCEECGNEEEEVVESCWGFYGDDPKENGMMSDISDELVEEIDG